MAYSDWLVDKRTVQRNISKGLVDQKELEKSMKALPDRADNIAEPEAEREDDADVGED